MELYTTKKDLAQMETAGAQRKLAARALLGLSAFCGLLPLLLGAAVLAMTAACFVLMLVGAVGPLPTLAILNCISIALIIAMDYLPGALRRWAVKIGDFDRAA